MPIDYDILRLIWWALLGILLIGFAILDGYDLGTAMLLPFVARTDGERRQVRETIEPTWEGHQVWFVLAGGAAFAAWPSLYAVSFSGFYVAMLLVLMALIVRPVSFNFRDKIDDSRWRSSWDWTLAVGGLVPSLVFGIAFGNLLLGVPFGFDADLRPAYTGTFFDLLNPFSLLAGVLSAAMLTTHGATWLALKADGDVAARAARVGRRAALVSALLFAIAGIWIALGIDGYVITGTLSHVGPSNPLAKAVTREAGAWFRNFGIHHWLVAAPALGVAGPLIASALLRPSGTIAAFLASALGIATTGPMPMISGGTPPVAKLT